MKYFINKKINNKILIKKWISMTIHLEGMIPRITIRKTFLIKSSNQEILCLMGIINWVNIQPASRYHRDIKSIMVSKIQIRIWWMSKWVMMRHKRNLELFVMEIIQTTSTILISNSSHGQMKVFNLISLIRPLTQTPLSTVPTTLSILRVILPRASSQSSVIRLWEWFLALIFMRQAPCKSIV